MEESISMRKHQPPNKTPAKKVCDRNITKTLPSLAPDVMPRQLCGDAPAVSAESGNEPSRAELRRSGCVNIYNGGRDSRVRM